VILSMPWLTSVQPQQDLVITYDLFKDAFRSQGPLRINDILRSLPLIELQVLATITHLELHQATNTTPSTLANSVSSSKRTVNGGISIRIVKEMYDKLTHSAISDIEIFIQYMLSLERKMLIEFHSFPMTKKSVSEVELVRLLYPPDLIQSVFADESDDEKVIITQYFRSAVLNPSTRLISTKIQSSVSGPQSELLGFDL